MKKIISKLISENKLIGHGYGLFVFFKHFFSKDIFNLEKVSLFVKVFPYTMVGYKRLSNVYELSKKASEDGLKGDFAECGVWRGGCSAVMAFIAQKEGIGRKTWLFDSFEGLPEPTKEDGELAESYSGNRAKGSLKTISQCVGPLEDVKKIFFDILKLKEENIKIEKGWFQDTLPEVKNKIGEIAILRLDGDWYESTKVCLDNLYDKVIKGGYVIIDDYGHWVGSKKALEEFFSSRKISPELTQIDYTGVYFRKN